VQLSAVTALQTMGEPASIGALNAASGSGLDGRLKRMSKVAARRIGAAAKKPEELNALKKQVENLQSANQKLEDRLVALEEASKSRGGKR